jgi:hypothetical protein
MIGSGILTCSGTLCDYTDMDGKMNQVVEEHPMEKHSFAKILESG